MCQALRATKTILVCAAFWCLLISPLSAQKIQESTPAVPNAGPDSNPVVEAGDNENLLLQKIIKALRLKNEKELKRFARQYTAEVQETDEQTQERLLSKLQVSGSLSAKYILQVNKKDDDHDLRNMLNLEVNHIVPDTVHFQMQAGLISDLAGEQYRDTLPSKTLRDVYDSYEHAAQGRLYQAYFTIENVARTESLVQLGRQEYYLDKAYYFDGLLAKVKLHEMLKVTTFGGLANYDFKGTKGEDWLLGGSLEFVPAAGTEISLHYIHLAEDAKEEGLHDDIYMVKGKQKFLDYFQASGYLTILAEKTSELDLKLEFLYPDLDLQIQVTGHALINRLEKVTTGIDPFTTFMTVQQPYQQLDVTVSKSFGKFWHIEAGYNGRRLDHSRDYGSFNREFSHFYLTGASNDYVWQNFSVSLAGEAWLADGHNTFYGVDGELAYHVSDGFKASAGADYTLYKYRYYYQDEKTDVYTLFAKASYKVSHYLETKGKYECEFEDSQVTHTVELEAQIVF
jgi:hypothetical protein